MHVFSFRGYVQTYLMLALLRFASIRFAWKRKKSHKLLYAKLFKTVAKHQKADILSHPYGT